MSAEDHDVCLWCAYLGSRTSREMNEADRQALSRQGAGLPDGAGDLACLYGLLKQRADSASPEDLLRAVLAAGPDCPEWRRHQDGQSPVTAFRTEQEQRSTDLMEDMLAWTRRRPRLAATVGIAGLGLTGVFLWLALWQ